jgi:ribonuclease HII
MSVHAGLDEAGYGPMLGPLTIGFSAFRREGTLDWSTLPDAVSDAPGQDGERLVVADSKKVFTRNPRGARRLEATALTFLHAAGTPVRRSSDLLRSAPDGLAPGPKVLAAHPWYRSLPELLPLHWRPEGLREHQERLAASLDAASAEVVAAGVAVIPAGSLNESFRRTDNKGATLWSYHSRVILHLFERFGEEGLDFTCDRLGGRARYGRALSILVPFSSVRVLSESRQESRYLVTSGERRMRIRFVQKGDTLSLPTALGSCFAKYARELVMGAFNDHFEAACPGVRPTAGYVTDARRWLEDMERALPDALPDRSSLIRSR